LRSPGQGQPVYKGDFRDGTKNGHGTISFDTGLTIEGEWRDGSLERGSATTPSGVHFEGQFREGKRNGIGTMVFPDGTRYEGKWKEGLPDGQGTLQA